MDEEEFNSPVNDSKMNSTDSFSASSLVLSLPSSIITSPSSFLSYPLNGTFIGWDSESVSSRLVCSWSDKKENVLESCRMCSLNRSEYLSFPCIDPAESFSSSMTSDLASPLLPEETSVILGGFPLVDVEDNVFEALSPTRSLEGVAKSLKNRIDLASVKAGAVSLGKSKAMNGADAVLMSSKYKYSLAECSREKWFVFSLAEMVSEWVKLIIRLLSMRLPLPIMNDSLPL